jgi:hypothetical protein
MIATETADRLAEEARRGQEAFDKHVRPLLRPEDDGKYVAIDIETGEYEMDKDDYAATGRMLARRPGARLWLFRAGHATTYRMGRRVGGGTT